MKMQEDYTPDNDGITHIWVSPKSNNDLGRMLHIGARRPFQHTEHGHFESVFGFWLWIDGNRSDSLRNVHHGNLQRTSLSGLLNTYGKYGEVEKATEMSILQSPAIHQALVDNNLPLVSYETIGDNIIPLEDRAWYLSRLEKIKRGERIT